MRELHASNSQLQWIVDAYNLVFAAFLLVAGSLVGPLRAQGHAARRPRAVRPRQRRRRADDSSGELIVARCVMGLGAAMVFPATLSLISNVFTERAERARAIGLWGATAGMAIALGPIVGGWLLERFSWSSIFFAMAPVAALAAVLVAWSVPTSRDPRAPRADRPGLRALERRDGGADLHDHRGARARLGERAHARRLRARRRCCSARSSTASAARASRCSTSSLFRNPRFTAASGSVTVAFFSLFGFIFLMTQYFQFIKRYGPLSAGRPPAAGGDARWASPRCSARKLAVRFGTKLVVTAGLVMVAAFYAWVAAVVAPGTGYGTIAAQMVLYGIGMGLTSAPATEAIMGVVPRAKAGVGSAVNDTTRLLGGTLGVAVIGSVYASLYSSRLTAHLPERVPARPRRRRPQLRRRRARGRPRPGCHRP